MSKLKNLNTIHKQTGLTCIGFALINAIEHKKGKILPPQAVYDFYTACKIDTPEERKSFRILQMAKVKGIGGYKIKNPKMIYNPKLKIKDKDAFLLELVEKIKDERYGIMIGITFREGREKIPLDKQFNFKPNLKKPFREDGHELYVLDVMAEDGPCESELVFKIENSWGSTWGEDGCFYMTEKEFWSEVIEVYSFQF